MIPGPYKQGIVWNDIKIGHDFYMISVTRRDEVTEVFLTNLTEIWMETLTTEIILDKCRKLNPLLNIAAINCSEIVANILSNISQYIVEASVEEIKLHAPLEGGLMKFSLNLTKGTCHHFGEIVMKPLCISSLEIIRQNKILVDLIKRKDEEIAEYKAEGAELIRKNIETETFKEEQLKTDIPVPNVAECARAFQGMVNFYNTLNLREHNEPSTKATSNDETDQTGQSVITLSNDGNNSGSREVVDKDILMLRKPGTSKFRSKSQKKKFPNKVTNNRIGVINMIHKPIKKAKKGLNDFIL
ncbi:non-homologous end-joining factor 1 isoform X2 [Andrena cerasifolii]|uniref:non-homologous end-joining factor 1 isoform X2 n=1 Tax=Andrena cerasifolii TaxID=2819439 RepID=UPI004038132F